MKVYYSDQLYFNSLGSPDFNLSLLESSYFSLVKGKWVLESYSCDEAFNNSEVEEKAKNLVEKANLNAKENLEAILSRVEPSKIICVQDDFVIYHGASCGRNEELISESSGSRFSYEGQFLGVYPFNKHLYFQGVRGNSGFQKRSLRLEPVWEYKLNRREYTSLDFLFFEGSVIYILPGEFDGGMRTKVISINDSCGSENWVDFYTFKVQNYILYEGLLLIAALEGFYVLDINKNEILYGFEFGYEGGGVNALDSHNANIYHDERRIYVCHSPLGKLYVFDLYDYSIVKEVSLPQGIHIDSFMGIGKTSGLYYFYASQPRKEVGNTFLLELDPNNLDAPIEFEPTPDISSRFVAAEGTPEQCELHIDITTESLDDAIRFGEITVRKLAMQHSLSLLRSGPCLAEQGLKPDERFNGTIRLVLHDVQGDTAQIDEYLATLKQRVDEWAAGFDTLVGWFKNPDTGGYIRTQVFPRRAGQPEQVRILPKGNPFAEHELDDFVSDLESDTLKLDNKHYVARLTELTEAITSEQSSPQDMATASYFQGTLAYMNNDEQAALEHYFTAAQQGCFTGVLSYMDLGGTPQPGQPLFTLVAAYNLIGQDAWSAQEDIDASIKRLTDSERHELDNAAQAIVDDWQRNDVKSFNLV